MPLTDFIERWSRSSAAERANKDAFLLELCEALGVERPKPMTGVPDDDRYVFEKDVVIVHEGDKRTIGRIDLYKQDFFLREAKQGSGELSKKIGTARRGTAAWNIAMLDAFGQALGYARTLPSPPPFLIVCDIGYCFDLYSSFDGSGNYQKWPVRSGSARSNSTSLNRRLARRWKLWMDGCRSWRHRERSALRDAAPGSSEDYCRRGA